MTFAHTHFGQAVYVASSLALLLGCYGSSAPEDGGTDAGRDARVPAPDAARDAAPDGGPLYPPGALGAPCTSSDECDDGLCLRQGLWPEGMCTGLCNSDSECPGDTFCQPLFGFCVPPCTPGVPGTCRPGYACAPRASGDRAGCMVGCYADADCRPGSVCAGPGSTDSIPNTCVRPDAPIGAPCTNADECAEAGFSCLGEELRAWPGGSCIGQLECDGAVRIEGSFSIGCLAGCSDGTPCRDGYRCVARGEDRVCLPGCEDDGDCTLPGRRCVPTLGTCAEPFVPSQVGRTCVLDDPRSCVGGWCARTSRDVAAPPRCLIAGCRLRGDGASRECPSGTACVEPWTETRAEYPELFDPDVGVCMLACDGSTECPAGTECRDGYCRW